MKDGTEESPMSPILKRLDAKRSFTFQNLRGRNWTQKASNAYSSATVRPKKYIASGITVQGKLR